MLADAKSAKRKRGFWGRRMESRGGDPGSHSPLFFCSDNRSCCTIDILPNGWRSGAHHPLWRIGFGATPLSSGFVPGKGGGRYTKKTVDTWRTVTRYISPSPRHVITAPRTEVARHVSLGSSAFERAITCSQSFCLRNKSIFSGSGAAGAASNAKTACPSGPCVPATFPPVLAL